MGAPNLVIASQYNLWIINKDWKTQVQSYVHSKPMKINDFFNQIFLLGFHSIVSGISTRKLQNHTILFGVRNLLLFGLTQLPIWLNSNKKVDTGVLSQESKRIWYQTINMRIHTKSIRQGRRRIKLTGSRNKHTGIVRYKEKKSE